MKVRDSLIYLSALFVKLTSQSELSDTIDSTTDLVVSMTNATTQISDSLVENYGCFYETGIYTKAE